MEFLVTNLWGDGNSPKFSQLVHLVKHSWGPMQQQQAFMMTSNTWKRQLFLLVWRNISHVIHYTDGYQETNASRHHEGYRFSAIPGPWPSHMSLGSGPVSAMAMLPGFQKPTWCHSTWHTPMQALRPSPPPVCLAGCLPCCRPSSIMASVSQLSSEASDVMLSRLSLPCLPIGLLPLLRPLAAPADSAPAAVPNGAGRQVMMGVLWVGPVGWAGSMLGRQIARQGILGVYGAHPLIQRQRCCGNCGSRLVMSGLPQWAHGWVIMQRCCAAHRGVALLPRRPMLRGFTTERETLQGRCALKIHVLALGCRMRLRDGCNVEEIAQVQQMLSWAGGSLASVMCVGYRPVWEPNQRCAVKIWGGGELNGWCPAFNTTR